MAANTARKIDAYLQKHGSPLAGYGSSFVQAGRRYGVSPLLLVAISGAESSFGKINSGAHNAWGWGPGISFPSWQAGIDGIAKGLKSGYISKGLTTPQAIGAKWAPSGAANDPTGLNSNWSKNVSRFLKELGGASVPLGMASGGPVSPPNGQAGASGGSTAPDPTQGILASLSEQAAGRPVMPTDTLAQLVGSLQAGGGSSAPAAVDPRGTLTPPKGGLRSANPVLQFANSQIGQPYVWGGESRKEGGFDCSGLIQAAYAKAGVSIPRTTWDQMKGGKKIGWNQLRPGDLVFSNGGGHVVLYAGNGKVIAAPHTGTVVQYQPLSRFRKGFVGARRYL